MVLRCKLNEFEYPINFNNITRIVEKYNLSSKTLSENLLFEKKILNKSKGVLKLLNKGELKSSINIEISYASKKAIEKVEKLGGSVKLLKGN